jgi:protein TonB
VKIIFITTLLVLSPFVGFTQEADSIEAHREVYTIVEQMPEFPGGRVELTKFISANLNYPKEAIAKNIQGLVYVNFLVGKDSVIRSVKVIRGIHELLDKEAIRIIRSMPNWIPGTQKGKVVSVSYNLPIRFILNN